MGFYNFCLSLAVYLILVGFFLRHDGAWTAILYLSHGLVFLFGGITILLVTVWRRYSDLGQALRSLLVPGLAFLPALIFAVNFVLFRVQRGEAVTVWPRLRYSASLLFTLSPLSAFGVGDRLLAAAYAFLLYGLIALQLWRLRGRWHSPELLLLAAAGMAAVFLIPVSAFGGTMITARLVYFPVFFLVAWLVSRSIPRTWQVLVVSVSLLIAGGM